VYQLRISGLLMGLAVWLASPGWAATGTVFEDVNGNGVRDLGEPGIGRVRLSDGYQITATDESGRWQMEIEDEAVIFVIKPTGYATAVSNSQIPQFYYIHQPAGSPAGLRYPGIEPTGPLPEEIDFALTKQVEPSVFEALLFADTQPETEVEIDYIRDRVVAGLIGTDAKFGMTMGDIMFDDMSLFPRLIDIIGQIGIPWYNVPGNHELNLLADSDRYSLETFKRYFGPPYYSFEYGGAHFFVLDNIQYNGNGESDPGDIRGSGGYIANFGKRQLQWLERALAYVPQDALVFLAMHSPLETYISDGPGVNTQDRRALFKLLSGRPNLYAVAGHTHTTEHVYFDKDDGFRGPGELHHHVLSTVSGSWWSGPFDEGGVPTTWQRDGTPNGYHVLEVNGADAKVRFKGAGRPDDYQMRIMYDVAHHGIRPDGLRDFRHGELFDGRMSVTHVPAASVLVNLFDGGPKSSVYFKVGNHQEMIMARSIRKDPLIDEMWTRNPDSKKSFVNAAVSSHLFEADLPDDLAPGVYTLSVRAVDEFGRTHHGHSILEITGR
jgi:calcineurin-like phosphoesterase family protein